MAKSYKVSVFAGTKVVADMAQQVKNATIEASLELKPIAGGATEATAVLLPVPNPLPVNSNRKRTKAIGWYKNATGPAWEAPKDYDNTNWWSYETGLWSLGSSVPMPTITVFDGFDSNSITDASSAKSTSILSKVKMDKNQRGIPNGVASLNSNGKITPTELDITGLNYKGLWNAELNSPSIVSGVGTNGDFYTVSVSGVQDLGNGEIEYMQFSHVIYYNGVWEQNIPGNNLSLAPAFFDDYFL